MTAFVNPDDLADLNVSEPLGLRIDHEPAYGLVVARRAENRHGRHRE